MTAAKVMDIIARLRWTSSWRSISFFSGKMEDAPKLSKISKSECADICIRLHRHKWPESWSSIEDPVVPLERNLYGHLLAVLHGKANLRKFYWSTVGPKFPIGIAYSYTVKKDYSLCVYVDEYWLERDKTLIRCGKYSTKKSNWENQHLSLIMYTWAALKDNVK